MDEQQTECGYFLRSKRRRLTAFASPPPSAHEEQRPRRKKCPIVQMPMEILLTIFGYLSSEFLANNVRLVNRRFKSVAQHVLNNKFKGLENRIGTQKKIVIRSMQQTKDDMETRCMCKMLNTLELLSFYHSLIRSTLWRYIYFKPSSQLCMYAGSLLDTFEEVLRQIIAEPSKIYSPAIMRDYALSNDVKTICNQSKLFALYFERISERPLNRDCFCTGSKVLDILDSATDCSRTVVSQSFTSTDVLLKLRYYFANAWFVSLEIAEEKSRDWGEQQRLMYMRLRRIVVNHSEMTMDYNHYVREVSIKSGPVSRIRKPINSVYTGYGEVGNNFFYYGVMNEGAYFSKFQYQIKKKLDEQSVLPCLALNVSVELKCPWQLAPYVIAAAYCKDVDVVHEMFVLTAHRGPKGAFALKMNFECTSPGTHRLPTLFSYNMMCTK